MIIDSTFDLSDHVEKNKHFGHKNQVIIIVCSAILLMVMLAAGLICMQDETKKGRYFIRHGF